MEAEGPPIGGLGGEAPRKGVLWAPMAQISSRAGKLSTESFQNAARRLRPVELQLEQLKEKSKGGQELSGKEDLIESWERAGYDEAHER